MKIRFNTKYLKTGGYAVFVCVIAIAILVVLNLFVNKLPTSWTQFDLSATDTYSLSDETIAYVEKLDKEITIYHVCETGAEDSNFTTMLNKLVELNDKIKVKTVDPVLNPGFLTGDKAKITTESLVIETEKRSKIISRYDIYYPGYGFTSEQDLAMYAQYYGQGQYPTAVFDFDNNVLSAMKYVTTDVLPTIYYLTGHNEITLPTDYVGYLDDESLALEALDLSTVSAVPEDCNCVLICIPQTDITADEAERLLSYLKAGGRLMYISSYEYTLEKEHTNLNTVLEYYGLSASEGYILEGDSNRHLTNNPGWIKASYGTHDVVDMLKGYNMYLGACQGIITSEELRETVTVTPLLTTSDKAYAKVNVESENTEKEEGDIEGPFDYAVAVSETTDEGKETRIVWVNTPIIILKNYDMYGTYAAMFVNSFAWMCEKEESISIPYKTFEQEMLDITSLQSTILAVVFTLVIPVTTIAVGFTVWFRRRRK